jgi:hypothetical protein
VIQQATRSAYIAFIIAHDSEDWANSGQTCPKDPFNERRHSGPRRLTDDGAFVKCPH